MLEKLKLKVSSKLPTAAFSLLGLGVIQAWTYLMMSQTRTTTDISYGYSQLFFDLGSLPIFLLFVFLARKFVPLFPKPTPTRISLGLMLAGDALITLTTLVPSLPPVLCIAGLCVAGCGSALITLCWWEIYAVLNPIEVAFYYAGSWIVGELLVFALAGYNSLYLLGAAFLLPMVGISFIAHGKKAVNSRGFSPKIQHGSASFPWKPMLLAGLYSFAYGCGTWIASYSDSLFMHLGTLIPALIVCASVLISSKRFNFTMVYRFILPLAIVGAFVLLLIPTGNEGLATLFIQTSYTSIVIYISILLCNLSRRYHISAAWLFSLFNITHIAFLGFGTLIFKALPSLVIIGICVICIMLVTFIVISEPTLASDWHIMLTAKGDSLEEQAHLEASLEGIMRQYGLTAREHEILVLFAQGDQPRTIGRKLNIAPGTVKAHIQHIYKKTGIHTKEELDDLVK